MDIDDGKIDINPDETNEWIESFQYIYKNFGLNRAKFLLNTLTKQINHNIKSKTEYINTINSLTKLNDKTFKLEKKIENIIKWNAVIIVLRASKLDPEIGGHIGTYLSASTLYEVGFNHFWRGQKINNGDLIYIQGHSSPGIYARSFLEGRFKKKHLDKFRQETDDYGLPSYPHPWLMKKYWQFPTVSMGLGPLQAIYQAKFIHYLINRNIINKKNTEKKIWCMCGDGEMDEPEALSAINLAGREQLNNLIFVINCNLQRLDGPVRGNSKIINELEDTFINANWLTIKVIWHKNWSDLIKKDKNNILKNRMQEVLDGDYQAYKGLNPNYMRNHFFNTIELKKLIKNYTDADIKNLHYGGHDYENIFHAYKKAINEPYKPVVILAKTTKGFGLGESIEASNNVHSNKYISNDNIITFKNNLKIPISNTDAIKLKFYKPKKNSDEINHIIKQRETLGGFLPYRKTQADTTLKIPQIDTFAQLLTYKKMHKSSTIMILVQIITKLCADYNIGKLIVPIVPDEARTFGMQTLFKDIKIYSKFGQQYKPIDSKQLIYYNESTSGQFLQEGINESGAFSSWLAAATSYSTVNTTTIPFYTFYSMFGFQRIGDLIWAAADARARGFLVGAIAGKTSLPGEGLQHCDGNSQIIASLIPNCISYDPTFKHELITIIHYGLQKMFKRQHDVFYYITTYNEAHEQPCLKLTNIMKKNIIKGIYCYKKGKNVKIELLGSGNILLEVIEASKLLKNDFNIDSNVWSVTSFTELARDGQKITRKNRLKNNNVKKPFITKCLEKSDNPVIAVSDYSRMYIEQIREFIPNELITLSADGFGISDSRPNLKKHFELNKFYITYAALCALHKKENISHNMLIKIKKKYNIVLNQKHPGLI